MEPSEHTITLSKVTAGHRMPHGWDQAYIPYLDLGLATFFPDVS